MPSAIKTAEEYGDDLQVIFVECQGTSEPDAEKFAYNKKWMGTSAMWTSERPFTTGARGLPNFALLSADGTLLMKGHPGSMHSKIIKAIDAEIAGAKKGPKDAPKALKSAYKAFAKGDAAKTFGIVTKVAAGTDVEEVDAAKAAEKMFQEAIDAKFKRVEWLQKNGYLIAAADVSKSLGKSLKGVPAYAEKVAALDATFSAPEMKAELKTTKALNKINAAMNEDGLDPKIAKKLQKFVDKNSEARVSKRARKLLSLFD